jgi:hypothetical protein
MKNDDLPANVRVLQQECPNCREYALHAHTPEYCITRLKTIAEMRFKRMEKLEEAVAHARKYLDYSVQLDLNRILGQP